MQQPVVVDVRLVTTQMRIEPKSCVARARTSLSAAGRRTQSSSTPIRSGGGASAATSSSRGTPARGERHRVDRLRRATTRARPEGREVAEQARRLRSPSESIPESSSGGFQRVNSSCTPLPHQAATIRRGAVRRGTISGPPDRRTAEHELRTKKGNIQLTQLQLPVPMPIALTFDFDWRVAAFAVAVSVGATLFSGLGAALDARRTTAAGVLRHDAGLSNQAFRRRAHRHAGRADDGVAGRSRCPDAKPRPAAGSWTQRGRRVDGDGLFPQLDTRLNRQVAFSSACSARQNPLVA